MASEWPGCACITGHVTRSMHVQDGPIRTYSDFAMMGRIPDCVSNPSRLCPLPDFLEQVQYELNDPRWSQECFFNGSVRRRLPPP